MPRRCGWTGSSELMIAYHDREWGVPVHDDRRHFEYLVLDAFQAGVSWAIVLRKRENFRRAFHGFAAEKIAAYDARKIRSLLADPGIIRNRLKVHAAVTNARAFLELQAREGTFDRFIWGFVGGAPKQNRRHSMSRVPPRTRESDRMSRALKERGFRFVGSTICYAYMQAAGLVNDHLIGCFRHSEVARP